MPDVGQVPLVVVPARLLIVPKNRLIGRQPGQVVGVDLLQLRLLLPGPNVELRSVSGPGLWRP